MLLFPVEFVPRISVRAAETTTRLKEHKRASKKMTSKTTSPNKSHCRLGLCYVFNLQPVPTAINELHSKTGLRTNCRKSLSTSSYTLFLVFPSLHAWFLILILRYNHSPTLRIELSHFDWLFVCKLKTNP